MFFFAGHILKAARHFFTFPKLSLMTGFMKAISIYFSLQKGEMSRLVTKEKKPSNFTAFKDLGG